LESLGVGQPFVGGQLKEFPVFSLTVDHSLFFVKFDSGSVTKSIEGREFFATLSQSVEDGFIGDMKV